MSKSKISDGIKSVTKKIENKLQHDSPAPHKLSVLFTVVSRQKAEFFADYLQTYEINVNFLLSAYGTASDETLSSLGIIPSDKAVIISIIRNDMIKPALNGLEEKFRTVRGGKGVAFVAPMTSTIGVAVYQFLCNKEK